MRAAPEPKNLEREVERYRKQSRRGCLGAVGALLAFAIGGGAFAFGQDAASKVLQVLGIVVMGFAFVVGLLAGALNVTMFGTYWAKRSQQRER